jgi:hypothetical protein
LLWIANIASTNVRPKWRDRAEENCLRLQNPAIRAFASECDSPSHPAICSFGRRLSGRIPLMPEDGVLFLGRIAAAEGHFMIIS